MPEETNTEAAEKAPKKALKKAPLKKLSVSCPALGGLPLQTEETDPEKAKEAFREACRGLSPDADLKVE